MTVTNNNTRTLHRKEWQMMTPLPTSTSAGAFVVSGSIGLSRYALMLASATVHYIYDFEEDGWVQVTSGALAGSFGAGACGVFTPWESFTANGGSTTTIQVAAGTYNICYAIGAQVEFTSGNNIGLLRTITDIEHAGGTGNTILTFDSAVGTAVANADTFKLNTGRVFVMNAGTTAAGIFKVFSFATRSWAASLATSGLPATWGTDGRMATASRWDVSYESFTADTVGATTVGLSTKTWTTNQWSNYQAHIISGTGLGQRRNITSNNGTTLTVPAWTTTPDATSVVQIEGSDDYLYLLGNNAVTMYRYSISGNSWSTATASPARSAAPSTGMTADTIGVTGSTAWADVSDIKDGRYLYSFRGGGTATLARYDIALAGWADMTYVGTETFTTGSSADACKNAIVIQKEGSATVVRRFFYYDVISNRLEPFSTLMYTDGAAAIGNKIWIKKIDEAGTVKWVYALGNSSTTLHRIMVI